MNFIIEDTADYVHEEFVWKEMKILFHYNIHNYTNTATSQKKTMLVFEFPIAFMEHLFVICSSVSFG